MPINSVCAISLQHLTKEHLNRRIYLSESVRITVMVADRSFLERNYLEHHASGVTSCPTNQWPLALAKNTDVNTNSDE